MGDSGPQFRAAVVGLGVLGTRYARVFRENSRTRLVALVDTNAERARDLGGRHNVPSYQSVQEMLDSERPDVVAVATPDFAHGEAALAALRAGAHVLVEKPLATDVPTARALVEEADRLGGMIMVNYSQRFVDDFVWIRDRIREGVIGRPLMVQSQKLDRLSVPTKMITWAVYTSPVFFMTSHDLDLVCWYLGARPVEVYAQEVRGVLSGRGIDVHDGVQAVVRFDSGVSALFHSSWILPDTYPVVAGGSLEVIGASGYIRYSMVDRTALLYAAESSQTIRFCGVHTADERDGLIAGAFRRSVDHFLDSVAAGVEPLTSARRTLPVTMTQCALMDSIKRNSVVRVVY